MTTTTTTETFLNNSTTLEEIKHESDEWPYFIIFGKTYFSFIVIILSVGLIGNVLSLILMSDAKVKSFAYCIYMRWLAVSDSILLITDCTEDITDTYGYLQTFMTYNIAICKIWGFVEMTARTLSPWLVVGLTVDRFICVLHPELRNKFCTKTKAVIVCSTLTFISTIANVGEISHNIIKNGECDTESDEVFLDYSIFQDLLGISLLPCLAVLILNLILVIRIRKSFAVRQRFQRSNSIAKYEDEDKSTRPLILVSMFAFATLIPINVTEVVEFLLEKSKADGRALELAHRIWPLFNLIYLLNFAQNFYIVMASSRYHRRIMANKFSCLGFRRRSFSDETMLIDVQEQEQEPQIDEVQQQDPPISDISSQLDSMMHNITIQRSGLANIPLS